MREALELVTRGELNASDFIVGEAPLADIVTVFQQMAAQSGRLKTVIIPPG